MAKFEAHITCDKEDAKQVEDIAQDTGWFFSVIAGCPLLGKGTYCYLTNYDSDEQALLGSMQNVQRQLHRHNIVEKRMKIERIIFDTKTGHNELGR
jgi:hypothetical protein